MGIVEKRLAYSWKDWVKTLQRGILMMPSINMENSRVLIKLLGGSATLESLFNYLSIPFRRRIQCFLLTFYFVRLHKILFKQSRFFWIAI